MIVTAVDYTYLLREGVYLIKSCWKHAPDQRFYLYLVNAPSSIDKDLCEWHGNIIIKHVKLPVLPNTWKGVMCCARTLPLKHVLHKYQEPTVYLDSDVILKQPLTELFSLLKHYDLSVLTREDSRILGPLGTEHAYKFNSGVIGLRPSAVGLEFVTRYCDDIQQRIASGQSIDQTHKGVYTALDQEYLYILYKEMASRLQFIPLDPTFNDSDFKPDSVVWHGKGHTRRQLEYKIEKAHYDEDRSRYLYYSGASRAQNMMRRGKKLVKRMLVRQDNANAAV